jgi:hypothetical protein
MPRHARYAQSSELLPPSQKQWRSSIEISSLKSVVAEVSSRGEPGTTQFFIH